jgi:TrmH family RNA methyltransferase
MIKSITSAQNQWVKDVLALQEKAKNRRAAGMFTVEGINEIRLAIKSGLVVKQLAINPDKMSWQELKKLLNVGIELDPTWMIEVLNSAWTKVVVRESGQNALAIGSQNREDFICWLSRLRNPGIWERCFDLPMPLRLMGL